MTGKCFLKLCVLFLAAGLSGTSLHADVDLADIVAGGDGSGTADPTIVGINPDDGTLQTGFLDNHIPLNDPALQPVDPAVSEFIDSVFVANASPMQINTGG